MRLPATIRHVRRAKDGVQCTAKDNGRPLAASF